MTDDFGFVFLIMFPRYESLRPIHAPVKEDIMKSGETTGVITESDTTF